MVIPVLLGIKHEQLLEQGLEHVSSALSKVYSVVPNNTVFLESAFPSDRDLL